MHSVRLCRNRYNLEGCVLTRSPLDDVHLQLCGVAARSNVGSFWYLMFRPPLKAVEVWK